MILQVANSCGKPRWPNLRNTYTFYSDSERHHFLMIPLSWKSCWKDGSANINTWDFWNEVWSLAAAGWNWYGSYWAQHCPHPEQTAVTFTLHSVCSLPRSRLLGWVCLLDCPVVPEFLGLWASWLPCLQWLSAWQSPGIPLHGSSKMLILVLVPAWSEEAMSWRVHNQLWLMINR